MKNVLCFDADDTLWECNIFYRNVMHGFSKEMSEIFTLDEHYVYQTILKYEHERLATYGYGSLGFRQCLKDVFNDFYHHYRSKVNYHKKIIWIDEITRLVINFEIQLLPDVEATLAELKKRDYQLFIITKGDHLEQEGKIKSSKLLSYFNSYRIMKEKHEKAYQLFLNDFDFHPNHTTMIGNSPKSDIMPCLNIEMNAVYIPHTYNWELEQAPLPEYHRRMLVLKSIKDLLFHFN
jgi:putative hydrolase of the HAD superfamily